MGPPGRPPLAGRGVGRQVSPGPIRLHHAQTATLAGSLDALLDRDNVAPDHHHASELHQGFVEAVRALVEEGKADVDKAKTTGVTPLMKAAQNGHLDVVSELIAASADQSIETTEPDAEEEIPVGSTALSVAQRKGHSEVVALLAAR